MTIQQKIEIKSIDENPGLLPFSLGTTKLFKSFIKNVHYYNLSTIEEHLVQLNQTLAFVQFDKNENTTQLHYRIQHFVDIMKIRLNNNFNRLYSVLLRNVRPKRGLLNFLGSGIKFVTGNLDEEDAKRYDSEILKLKMNQNILEQNVQNSFKLNKNLILNYENNIATLNRNQIRINNNLLDLHANYKNLSLEFNQMIVFNTMSENIQLMTNILLEMEESVVFAKQNALHISIIKPNELYTLLKNIASVYGSKVLPFPIDNLDYYYSCIRIISYIKDYIIYFILQIPITYTDDFIQYKLLPIPNKNNMILYPEKQFITLNKETFWFHNEPCKNFGSINFCDKLVHLNLIEDQCIPNLIQNENSKNCKLLPVKINSKIFIEVIDEQHSLVISKNTQKIHTNCGNNVLIKGSNLLTLPQNCYIQINNEFFMNYQQSKLEIPILIPDVHNYEKIKIENYKPIELDKINLKEIHKLSMDAQENPNEILNISDNLIKYSFAPIYVILILIIIIYVINKRKDVSKYCFKEKELTETNEQINLPFQNI